MTTSDMPPRSSDGPSKGSVHPESIDGFRWLVTGSAGQLGSELVGLLAELGAQDVRGVDRRVVDITDERAARQAVEAWLKDGQGRTPVVINCAAYTAVDDAESDEDTALVVNGDGPRNLAAVTSGRARLVHVSTDYVFAGDATEPYPTDAPTGPRTAYGRTKLAGDNAVLTEAPDTGYVVRTAWLYGAHGPNFVKTMAKLAATHETLTVVDDQVGSPTWAGHLARGLVDLAMSEAPAGVYHCTGDGSCTWFEFARAIFSELGLDPERVTPTTSDAFKRPAPRPAYSVLSNQRWRDVGLTPLPNWRDGLREAFARDASAFRP